MLIQQYNLKQRPNLFQYHNSMLLDDKSLFQVFFRIVTGFVQSMIKLCGLDWTVPNYSTVCRRKRHIDIAILYQKSSAGLHLLIDSTRLKFLGEGEWKYKKLKPEYRHQRCKLHIGIDA